MLKVENMIASLPPDITLSTPQNAQEEAMLGNALEEVVDTDETEDMDQRKWRSKRQRLQKWRSEWKCKNWILMEECQGNFHQQGQCNLQRTTVN